MNTIMIIFRCFYLSLLFFGSSYRLGVFGGGNGSDRNDFDGGGNDFDGGCDAGDAVDTVDTVDTVDAVDAVDNINGFDGIDADDTDDAVDAVDTVDLFLFLFL